MMNGKMVSGLLVSQIGYDSGAGVRVIYRGASADYLKTGICMLRDNDGCTISQQLTYWGEIWGSHWWTADFTTGDVPDGEYSVTIIDENGVAASGETIDVAPNILWEKSWRHVSYEQLERRAIMAKQKPGWFDAGALWQEANSHAAMILGLCDLINYRGDMMTADELHRLTTQLKGGCDYLLLCRDRAVELGHTDGIFLHDVLDHQNVITIGDNSKAAACLAAAANSKAQLTDDARDKYRTASAKCLDWLLKTAQPAGAFGFEKRAHGYSDSFIVPDEHRTSDLLMMLQAAVELTIGGYAGMMPVCEDLATQIIARQVPRQEAQDGIYGHFYTFASAKLTEKSWSHNVSSTGAYGSDMGQTFPQYIMPLISMTRAWPRHPHAALWQETIRSYAYNFLQPACGLNPFGILPLGYFPYQGWLHFAALWHGMNAVYGLAAALAIEFEQMFNDDAFRRIAINNLQWIAGLNGGLTTESMKAAYMMSYDIPSDAALPVSMIHGVGRRYAGSWMNIRGSICNGFAVGKQFELDVEPTIEIDGPHSFSDEEWITHAGGWLSGLVRL